MQEGGRAPVDAPSRRPGPGPEEPLRHARLILALTVAATVAVDQVSKALAAHLLASGRPAAAVGGFFDLELTRNSGGAFGMLASSPVLFLLATVVIVGAVLAWGVRSGQAPVGLGLVAGGGLGNLIDRLARAPGGLQGKVVDFIHFHFWPTFNLADSAIVVGVGLLVVLELRPRKQ